MENKIITVKVTFTEEVLGSSPADKDVYRNFIGSKAPDAATVEEEVESLGVDAVIEKGMTVFPRDENGAPHLWDYQWKGYFKDTCKALKNVPGTESSKLKAYKQKIDKLIFPEPRKIVFHDYGEVGVCQRPLRASTPQGERTALAMSESIPAGAWVEFSIRLLVDADEKLVREWLDYGVLSGIGQWRNSGKGKFTWAEVK